MSKPNYPDLVRTISICCKSEKTDDETAFVEKVIDGLKKSEDWPCYNNEFPLLGEKIKKLPFDTKESRSLEMFEGIVILSELTASNGDTYIEKFCAQNKKTTRTLIVKSSKNAVNSYLNKDIGMYTLLFGYDHTDKFLYDISKNGEKFITRILNESQLPRKYIPKIKTFYNQDLSPK